MGDSKRSTPPRLARYTITCSRPNITDDSVAVFKVETDAATLAKSLCKCKCTQPCTCPDYLVHAMHEERWSAKQRETVLQYQAQAQAKVQTKADGKVQPKAGHRADQGEKPLYFVMRRKGDLVDEHVRDLDTAALASAFVDAHTCKCPPTAITCLCPSYMVKDQSSTWMMGVECLV